MTGRGKKKGKKDVATSETTHQGESSQGQLPSKSDKSKNQSPVQSTNNVKGWSDPKFNESSLTMGQLQDMIKTLATQIYDKKYEDLKNDMEEEVEWRVTAQCEELEETVDNLKEELKTIKKDRESLKQELNTIKQEGETLKVENRKLRRCVERCEYKLSCIKTKQLKDLKIKMDEIEQKCLERDVQIVGAPELPEDLDGDEEKEMQMIVKLAKEKMNITLKKDNIEKIHRLGKRKLDRPRDLVIRFRNNITRNQFYRKRKETSNNSDPQKNIYINDHLTEYRRNLFYTARQLVKRKKVFAAWSQQGNILIRKTEGDQVIQVHSHEHLAELQLIEDVSEELDDSSLYPASSDVNEDSSQVDSDF